MKRNKKPPTVNDDKKKVRAIIESLSDDWKPEERETSILFDYHEKRVHLETSYGPTARRWFRNLWGDPAVTWDAKASTCKISVPWSYCRSADLILKAKYRQYDD